MARDADDNLKRINEALLEEEDEEEEFPEAAVSGSPVEYGNRIRNADRVDVDPEEFSEAVEQPRSRAGMVILILLLMAAAFLGLAWWLSRNGGLL